MLKALFLLSCGLLLSNLPALANAGSAPSDGLAGYTRYSCDNSDGWCKGQGARFISSLTLPQEAGPVSYGSKTYKAMINGHLVNYRGLLILLPCIFQFASHQSYSHTGRYLKQVLQQHPSEVLAG